MILTISPSSIENLQECPQKYNYSSMRRLSPLDEKRDKMDRGTLFHSMLAMHYNLIIKGNEDESLKLEQNQVILAVTAFARQTVQDDEYEHDMVEECIKNYQEYAVFYAGDGWTPLRVETPFSKIIYEDERHQIINEGRIDLIAKSLDGQIFPVDHKTSDKNDIPSLLSNQFMDYCWATESNNIIKNSVGFQKSYGPAMRFHRHVLSYDKTLIDEWRENVIMDALQLINFIEKDYFPRKYSSCFRCKYKKLCETTPDSREFKISSMFKIGEPYDIYSKA